VFLIVTSEDLQQIVVDLMILVNIQISDLVSLSKNPPDLLSLSTNFDEQPLDLQQI